MEPIVSPWLIYGIEMLRYVNTVVVIGLTISAAVMFLFMFDFVYSDDVSDGDKVAAKKNMWKPAVVAVILLAAWVIIPSRDTAYKMLMASYVTPNNIHMVGNEANEAVSILLDNITNHMKELKDNK